MKIKSSFRIRLVSFGLLLFALLLIGKLYYVQIVHGKAYAERADRQYVRTNQSIFDRGSIFFEGKDGTLVAGATLKTGYTFVLNPKLVADPSYLYKKIAPIFFIDQSTFLAKAGKKNDAYEEIAKRLDEETVKKIEELKIPAISFIKEKWRFYPSDYLSSHVLGFVGYKGDILSGRYGLENYYDEVLQRAENSLNVNFFAELFSDIGDTVEGRPQEGDLVVTIEPTTEIYLEKTLEKIQKDWSPSLAGGIVIDPWTGEVRAMAVVPTFNPNAYNKEKSAAIFSNPLVEGVYEMGSIVKPLTMAAGIDAGVVTARTTYDDKGFLVIDGKKISNFDKKGRGVVSMQEVLNQSLNTGVAVVEQKLGNQKFSDYMFGFGLGEKTGIDLPNEATNLSQNLKSPRDIEHATASFGQGIALTPIATVRALSSLANGGYLVKPHVVKEIKYTIGLSKKFAESSPKRQVISKSTSEEITRMLTEAVDKGLLGGSLKLAHTSVAAKTGTAQIAKPGGGGYYEDRFLHSFFGYFPSYNPKFLVFLYMVNPKSTGFASDTLGRPFFDIVKFMIDYYQIPPDR